jgi:hypothetical protein
VKAEQAEEAKAAKQLERENAKQQREQGVLNRLYTQLENLSVEPCGDNIDELKAQLKTLNAVREKSLAAVAVDASSPHGSMASLELSEDEYESSVEGDDEIDAIELSRFEHEGVDYYKGDVDSDGCFSIYAMNGSMESMGVFNTLTQAIES